VTKHIRHIRQHAQKHNEAYKKLKDLLSRTLHTEKVWSTFISTFVAAIVTITLFLNWGNITSFFTGEDTKKTTQQEEIVNINGFQKGIVATYQINGQSADQYIRFIRQIKGQGHMVGIQATDAIGKAKEEEAQIKQDTLINSIFLSNDLSKGNHLTDLREGGKILQKSILATFYLGEKTVDLNSTIQTDSKLLSKISNTLGVDIFAYLNQSNNRSTTLDNYINLLEILLNNAQQRSSELGSKIAFLSQNFEAQERTIQLTEDAFFKNLKIFDGENAETELSDFIGLQQEQSEVKAKIGAYTGLRGYYEFFIPQLENLLRAIKANRDPLIAGVKVVEIQNMTLPLIIRER